MAILIRTQCAACKTNCSLATNSLQVNRLLAGRPVIGSCNNCGTALAFKVDTYRVKEQAL